VAWLDSVFSIVESIVPIPLAFYAEISKIVSEMLGHSSIAITLDTYIHVIPGLGEVAVSAMEDVLSDDEDNSIDQLDDEERP
jgi:hypothetical protein